ncbi:MAG: DNA/RNA non-specific endonuclease [Limosilactobacillus sp.]
MTVLSKRIKFFQTVSLLAVGLIIGSCLTAYHDFRQSQQIRLEFAKLDHRPAHQVGGLTEKQRYRLSQLDYHPGSNPVILVNHGRSTLNPNAWREDKVLYQRLDQMRRTSGSNTAFLNSRNHANTQLRTAQVFQPTGWHNNSDGNLVYNRGHLLAYSLTGGIDQRTGKFRAGTLGDQDNPRNLFTETDFTNEILQTYYEGLVRHAIVQGKHVVYQATPIFRGDEAMARGINLQALSTDGSLNFNVFLFNIEPGVSFDYRTGTMQANQHMRVYVPIYMNENDSDDYSAGDGNLRVYGHYTPPFANEPRHYYRLN